MSGTVYVGGMRVMFTQETNAWSIHTEFETAGGTMVPYRS